MVDAPEIPWRSRLWNGSVISLRQAHRFYSDKADDGWVIAANHLYWKQVLSEPKSLALAEIDPATLSVSSIGFKIGAHAVPVHLEALRPGMVEFLKALLALDKAGSELPAGEASV